MFAIQQHRFAILIALLISIGVMVRLSPLLDEQRMIYSISEDGYLMMTIARNMALGSGMSTSDGTILTNGTQPLATALWTIGYWVMNGDKIKGIMWVILMQFIISSLAAVLLWQGSKKILRQHPTAGIIAALAAATWYASPIITRHTMNGLETGLYALCLIGVAMIFSLTVHCWSMRRCVGLGMLLGVTFWARNDAVFFIFAICVTHLLLGPLDFNQLKQRFLQVLVIGTTSVVIASPWLINNLLNFGSLMPISGHSQSLNIEFADNFWKMPPIIIEYLLAFSPIPYKTQTWMIVICTLMVFAVFGLFAHLWPRFNMIQRRLVMLVSIYSLCLVCFYGFYFGAGHFTSRYLFPTTPFLVLLWASIIVFVWQHKYLTKLRPIKPVFVLLFISIVVGLHIRSYQSGYLLAYTSSHRFIQLVEWVKKNVDTEVWIAGTQTGTLGYFYDRTINLDGKVNPEALKARNERQISQYVLKKNIQYIVDWALIMKFWPTDKPLIQENFELIVFEPQKGYFGLAVLRRKGISYSRPASSPPISF